MTTPRVFISMGTPYTPDYARFRDELETFLRDQCGVDPRIIGKNEYPSGSPLNKIREVMSTCDGVIIVAYERKHVSRGSEKRGSDAETALTNRTYTTTWNHVESAIAFTLGLPLHIICQTGLAEEGLIETKVDWYVQRIDIVPGAFNLPSVTQSLQSWIKDRVVVHANRPSFLRALQGQSRLRDMTPVEILGVLGALAAAFAAGVWAAHAWPTLFP